MTHTEDTWIKEFDQVFGASLWQSSRPEPHYKGEPYTYTSCGEDVKYFIHKILLSQKAVWQKEERERIRKKILNSTSYSDAKGNRIFFIDGVREALQ
jgi:hypothetical protein